MDGNARIRDLWCDGWHVALLTDGEPVVERGEPPMDATQVDPARLECVSNRLNVAADGWIVGFGDGDPLLLPAQAPEHHRARKVYGSRVSRRRSSP